MIALAVSACTAATDRTPSLEADAGAAGRSLPRDARSLDAHHSADAAPGDPATPDAAPVVDAGTDLGLAGSVSCYSEVAPDTSCTLPTHCCFNDYSAQHSGSCETSSCTWGTIDCDGPEDCATGQHCCAHAIIDPDNGIIGHTLACQATACGAPPVDQELCHPTSSAAGTCASGTACVSAADHDYDLPRTLYICQ
jgi:hypothetical protein